MNPCARELQPGLQATRSVTHTCAHTDARADAHPVSLPLAFCLAAPSAWGHLPLCLAKSPATSASHRPPLPARDPLGLVSYLTWRVVRPHFVVWVTHHCHLEGGAPRIYSRGPHTWSCSTALRKQAEGSKGHPRHSVPGDEPRSTGLLQEHLRGPCPGSPRCLGPVSLQV